MMKIDYELAEKIGATHYFEMRNGDGYTLIDSSTINTHSNGMFSVGKFACVDKHGSVVETMATSFGLDFLLSKVKPIPPKPPVTVGYEKVTESIFDLKDEFERGVLFTKKFNQEWHKIKTEVQLGGLLSMNDDPTKNGIYRRIEKTVDWQNAVVECMKGQPEDGATMNQDLVDELNAAGWGYMTDNDFLEMCRVALHANGEL